MPDIHIAELEKNHAAFFPDFDKEEFRGYLRDFEVPEGQRLQQMSYGQKKKVVISLGLATHAPVLLMDEPTNGLDIISKSQFRKIVAGIVNSGRCIVISTHQVRDLENLIDAVVILDAGQILFNESLDSIAEKIAFTFSSDNTVPSSALYSEATLNGTGVVLPNEGMQDTKVDLELLYKAVMQRPGEMKKIFQRP